MLLAHLREHKMRGGKVMQADNDNRADARKDMISDCIKGRGKADDVSKHSRYCEVAPDDFILP